VAEPTPRVLIVEDHTMLAESLALALRLRGFDEVDIVPSSSLSPDGVVECVRSSKPEVVLLDLNLGHQGTSIPIIGRIVELGATVLMLTATEDPAMLGRCVEAGAAGVFSKTMPFESLMPAVTDAARGLSTMRPADRDALLDELARYRLDTGAARSRFDELTDREAAVLTAIIGGSTADEIARSQFVALSTVRSHIRAVLAKLGVNSQLGAVALARRVGWPDTDAES
jgi:DNA-binding NarL/FixJ family response regulator